jgi:hypothetical protein
MEREQMAEQQERRWPRPLTEVSLCTSQITSAAYLWNVSRSNRKGGLIAFSGTYRHGSAGADDARLVRRRTEDFIDHGSSGGLPWGVIIDLRDLEYEWGDDLDMPSPQRTHVPLLVLVRPQQVEAYAGVLPRGERSQKWTEPEMDESPFSAPASFLHRGSHCQSVADPGVFQMIHVSVAGLPRCRP